MESYVLERLNAGEGASIETDERLVPLMGSSSVRAVATTLLKAMATHQANNGSEPDLISLGGIAEDLSKTLVKLRNTVKTRARMVKLRNKKQDSEQDPLIRSDTNYSLYQRRFVRLSTYS